MERMGDPALTPREHFSYRNYRTWPDSERWELIGGQAWSMSPAPTRRHQEVAGRLFTQLSTFLRGRPCKVYSAPFDVLLPEGEEPDEEVDTVVQPDVLVICDRTKLRDFGARGSPDLVIEVLSPSTSRKDQNEKLALYEKRGVKEYWVIDPWPWSIWVYHRAAEGSFDGGQLRERLRDRSPIASMAIEGFLVEPDELFADLD
jgi:Uma2 family endonuclease